MAKTLNLKSRRGLIGLCVVLLTAMLIWKDFSFTSCAKPSLNCEKSLCDVTISQTTQVEKVKPAQKTDAVILLSMTRSGSSIVGSIFNERSNVLYLYEPLFPFGMQDCDKRARNRLKF